MRSAARGGNALLLTASVGLALAVAEIVLRVGPSAPSLVRDPGAPLRLNPDPAYIPGVSGVANVEVSELGLRADPPTPGHALRVIAMGGSTTECIVLDTAEAWPAILQSLLTQELGVPVWIGNAGVSGRRSSHHVMQIEPLLDLVGDVDAVLLLVGVNDLLASLRGAESSADWYEDPRSRVDTHYEAFSVPAPPSFGPLWERLALVHTARRAQQALRLALLQDEAIQADPGRRYQAARALRRSRPMIDDLPDLGQATSAYRRNLERVIEAARARDTEVILVTHPALWRDDLSPGLDSLLWLGEKDEARSPAGPGSYTAGTLARGLEQFNQVTLNVCADRSLSCFDLAAALPSDTTIFYDDVHFNERGARAVAGALAPFLAEVLGSR